MVEIMAGWTIGMLIGTGIVKFILWRVERGCPICKETREALRG